MTFQVGKHYRGCESGRIVKYLNHEEVRGSWCHTFKVVQEALSPPPVALDWLTKGRTFKIDSEHCELHKGDMNYDPAPEFDEQCIKINKTRVPVSKIRSLLNTY